MNKKYHPSM